MKYKLFMMMVSSFATLAIAHEDMLKEKISLLTEQGYFQDFSAEYLEKAMDDMFIPLALTIKESVKQQLELVPRKQDESIDEWCARVEEFKAQIAIETKVVKLRNLTFFKDISDDNLKKSMEECPQGNISWHKYIKILKEFMRKNLKVEPGVDINELSTDIGVYLLTNERKYYELHPRMLHESTETWIERIKQIKEQEALLSQSKVKSVGKAGLVALLAGGAGYLLYKTYSKDQSKDQAKPSGE